MTDEEIIQRGKDLLDGLLPEHVRAVVDFASYLGQREDAAEVEAFKHDTELHKRLEAARAEFDQGDTKHLMRS